MGYWPVWADEDYAIRCVYVYPDKKQGRLQVYFKSGGTTFHARLVAAIKLRRPLTKTEVVHHINGDPTDDRFENLAITTWGEHSRLHQIERWSRPRVCKGCGGELEDRTFACADCAARHRYNRLKGRLYIAVGCKGCGVSLQEYTPDCKTCWERSRRRQRISSRAAAA